MHVQVIAVQCAVALLLYDLIHLVSYSRSIAYYLLYIASLSDSKMKTLTVWVILVLISEIELIYGQPQCTQPEDFNPFGEQRSPECINALLLLGVGNFSNMVLEAVCRDQDCGGELYNFYLNPCLDPQNATSIALGCSENINGNFCVPLVTNLPVLGQPFFDACGSLISGIVDTCSLECAAALVSLSNLFGCCITTQALVANPDFGVASGDNPFFNNQIFSMCDLEPPNACANPFSEACPIDETQCPGDDLEIGSTSVTCIPAEWICDEIGDCPGDRDELNCPMIPLEVRFTGDTPAVTVDSIEIEVVANKPRAVILCTLELLSRTDPDRGPAGPIADTVDCSSGRVSMTYNVSSHPVPYFRVTVNASTSSERVIIRRRVLVNPSRCTVNLINGGETGVTQNGNTTIIEFQANGPFSSVRCSLDQQDFFQCSSPVIQAGLGEGVHILKIIPYGPACRMNRNSVKAEFSV